MAAASLVLCVGGFLAGVIISVRMPPDALTREQNGGSGGLRIVQNIAGWVLIAAGVAMMVLPGPGLIVLLLGVMLADFPGKKRVREWVMSRKKVMDGVNRLRKKYGRPPLQKPRG